MSHKIAEMQIKIGKYAQLFCFVLALFHCRQFVNIRKPLNVHNENRTDSILSNSSVKPANQILTICSSVTHDT